MNLPLELEIQEVDRSEKLEPVCPSVRKQSVSLTPEELLEEIRIRIHRCLRFSKTTNETAELLEPPDDNMVHWSGETEDEIADTAAWIDHVIIISST